MWHIELAAEIIHSVVLSLEIDANMHGRDLFRKQYFLLVLMTAIVSMGSCSGSRDTTAETVSMNAERVLPDLEEGAVWSLPAFKLFASEEDLITYENASMKGNQKQINVLRKNGKFDYIGPSRVRILKVPTRGRASTLTAVHVAVLDDKNEPVCTGYVVLPIFDISEKLSRSEDAQQ